jgi:hypothetical protein
VKLKIIVETCGAEPDGVNALIVSVLIKAGEASNWRYLEQYGVSTTKFPPSLLPI